MNTHIKKLLSNTFSFLLALFRSKWLKYTILIFIILNIVGIFYSNYAIKNIPDNRIYSDSATIPFNNVGLVLGANKHTIYYKYRIDAAATLFHSGKIKHLLVSGDNHVITYDEANDMRKSLIKKGIPDSCIVMDFAGFRTFDSVVRCKKVFGQDSVTIISQKFHIKRAIYIANHFNLYAIGFAAKNTPKYSNTDLDFRELLARYKAFLDIYILDTSPKFLGKPVQISN